VLYSRRSPPTHSFAARPKEHKDKESWIADQVRNDSQGTNAVAIALQLARV
jgi:hypothetical protein